MTAICKVTHPLDAGNPAVLKSAPDIPPTAVKPAQIAAESTEIPPGMLNAVSAEDKAIAGDAPTGDPCATSLARRGRSAHPRVSRQRNSPRRSGSGRKVGKRIAARDSCVRLAAAVKG